MLKVDFFRNLGYIAAGSALALVKGTSRADAASAETLVGLWEMTVAGKDGTYRYIYAISPGSWVGAGDTDAAFQGRKYSPTMGAYIQTAEGSYRYEERGWIYDLKGTNTGTFTSSGTLRLNSDGKTLTGPGTYVEFDLKGKRVYTEPFSANARRVAL